VSKPGADGPEPIAALGCADYGGASDFAKENDRMNRNTIVRTTLGAGLALAGLVAGCGPSYDEQRPPVDQIDKRDSGLQSKDVLQASDKLANDLLSLPQLNESREQWTIVVDKVEDHTRDNQFSGDYNIFLQRLQTNLARQGHGRVTLVENRERFYGLRDRELEQGGGGGGGDQFGQGGRGAGGGGSGAPGAVSPDYSLWARAMDLPGRGTTYYNIQFSLVDLHTRVSVWTRDYEVKVMRK
jgi:hypothetical protein